METEVLIKEAYKMANKEKSKILARFFKTDKGEYGEGDIFIGLTVPKSREIAKKYKDLELVEISKLIKNKVHEIRLIALVILVEKFKLAEKNRDEKTKQKIFKFYLQNIKSINNWDLVDLSSPNIIGQYLLNKNDKEKSILIKLANSKNLWEQRISIISTFAFICKRKHKWTIKLAEKLFLHKHDLIQKAVGWMLREVGKRVDEKILISFLDKHSKEMPRTELRYAIEKLPEKTRKYYLGK